MGRARLEPSYVGLFGQIMATMAALHCQRLADLEPRAIRTGMPGTQVSRSLKGEINDSV